MAVKKKNAKGYQRGGFVPPPPKKTSKAAPSAKKRKAPSRPKPKMPTMGGNLMGLGGTGAGGGLP